MTKIKNKKPFKSNEIALDDIMPNWSIGQFYIKVLYRTTKKMVNNVKISLVEEHKKLNDELSNAQKINKLSNYINPVLNKWETIYSKQSKPIANTFVDKVDKDVKGQITRSINKHISNDLVVKFSKQSQETLAKCQGIIKENVALIKSIPTKFHEQIQFAVNESMQQGRDWRYLEKSLQKIYSTTEKRARFIAKDQIWKATSTISHARQKELGVTEQEWVYTWISHEHRKSHIAANGKRYDIDKGCLIDGKEIFPAQEPGCKCTSRIIITLNGKVY